MKDIRYHNIISPKIEYYATIAGYNISSIVFFEKLKKGEKYYDHFFAAGNEILFEEKGMRFYGTGGGLCEYMFGVDQPLPDLIRKDVLNRLIIFGAFHSMLYDKIIFTDEVKGYIDYEDIFLKGHAVNNYYFFLQSDYKGTIRARQEAICKAIGKILKRSKWVGLANDEELAYEILDNLKEKKTTLLLIRVKNIDNEGYYDLFKNFYKKSKSISPEAEKILEEFANQNDIPQYQRERIQIDVIYKHEEHKHIVDEYKDILIEGQKKGLTDFQKARLKRLRALSMRNNIPSSLFDTLDELLLESKEAIEIYEPDYLRESRIILESIFIHSEGIESQVTKEDLQKLLLAKKVAVQLRSNSFEEMLLEIGRLCDESIRDRNDYRPLENFSYIIAYFDRFDSCANFINRIAFMQGVKVSEDTLRSLFGSMKEFNKIADNLFSKLFINDLLKDKYLSKFGYRKTKLLQEGFNKILLNEMSLGELTAEINLIAKEEYLYYEMHKYLRQRIPNYYWDLSSKKEIAIFQNELFDYLRSNNFQEKEDFIKVVFDKVIFDLKKESFYVRNILPKVITNHDIKLREDFIENSGMDRFIIEELERKYLEMQEMDVSYIEWELGISN